MKHLLAALAAVACSVTQLFAGKAVILGWNHNSETNIAGYRIYMGTSSRNYTWIFDTGAPINGMVIAATGHTVTNFTQYPHKVFTNGTALPPLTFYAVTAYNTSGNESLYSNEVSLEDFNAVTPSAPTNLRIP